VSGIKTPTGPTPVCTFAKVKVISQTSVGTGVLSKFVKKSRTITPRMPYERTGVFSQFDTKKKYGGDDTVGVSF
jgi:hypothetical protein